MANIHKNLEKYRQEVTMPGGWKFNQVRNLRLIDLYYNSKFESGEIDSLGRRKFFYNIVKPACDIATKFIDVDTKDIRLFSRKSGMEFKTWVQTRDLRHWMKQQGFGRMINKLERHYPKWGHIVVKSNRDGLSETNMVNLRVDPSSPSLEESPFVYELHRMSRRDIKNMPWDDAKVRELFERHKKKNDFLVFECYDRQPEGKKWKRTFKAEVLTVIDDGTLTKTPESQINEDNEYVPSKVLHEDELDELPYFESKFAEIEGRWQGLGFVEYLFDNQIRMNEVTNVKARGLEYSGLNIFQTADELIERNVLEDMQNGDIIKSPTGIQPVNTRAKDLQAFAQEEGRWDMNTQRKTFDFDITRGETLPSGTTLGTARLTSQAVQSFYNIKRENFGMFLKEILMEEIIPSFKDDQRDEHIMRFTSSDEEIEKLYSALVDHKVRKAVMDFVSETGTVPSHTSVDFERKRIQLLMEDQEEFELKIPKGFYDNTSEDVEMTIVSENVDTQNMTNTLMTTLQTIASNPTILRDKTLRQIFNKVLEMSGISGVDLGTVRSGEAERQQDAQPQPGGSPPRQGPQQAQTANIEQTL